MGAYEPWRKEAALNDSIAARVDELMAAADSLESIANEGRESDDMMGCAYIEALKSLREAQATAQKRNRQCQTL